MDELDWVGGDIASWGLDYQQVGFRMGWIFKFCTRMV